MTGLMLNRFADGNWSRMARPLLLPLLFASLAVLPGCGMFKGSRPKQQTAGERIAVLDFEQQVEAEAELQGLPVVLPAATVNAGWTQAAGSPSGAMGHLSLAENPSRVWSASIGKGSDKTRRLNATPVVADNRLFVMDTEGAVTAFDAANGQRLWRTQLPDEREAGRAAFGGGVSVQDSRVFLTTGLGTVAALDPATGSVLWQIRRPTPLRAAPTVVGGRLFVTSQDSQLAALSALDGSELWQVNATIEPAAILGAGAPAVAMNTAVAGFASGELFAMRVENGRTVWQDQLARTGRTTALGALSGIAASPVIDNGRVFAIGHGGRMLALELATGQRVWEREFAGVHTPAVAGDWVFAVTVDAQLVALTRTDGKVRWVKQLDRWRNAKNRKGAIEWAGPLLAGGRLYVVSSRGVMAAVSPQTGEILATSKLADDAYLPPIVANRTLYMLTDDGTVTAYR